MEIQVGNFWERLKSSVTLKIIFIGFLILILQIPTLMISNLIREREERKSDAIAEISSKWGGRQVLTGPFLIIPAVEKTQVSDGKRNYEKTVYHEIIVLPENLKINGKLQPEIRYRGIYQAVLFNGKFQLEGDFQFARGTLDRFERPNLEIRYREAILVCGISDMKGMVGTQVSIDGQQLRPIPGVPANHLVKSGFQVRLDSKPPQPSGKLNFKLDLDLNGSSSVFFYPLGIQNQVDINSPWQAPSFQGEFLPKERKVDAQGFSAQWQITDMNRNYPQVWMNGENNIDKSEFGVGFYVAANVYQQTVRAVRYSVLFIIFTMLTFLFAEAVTKSWVHPIQYFLIGLAIVIFYCLLLSLGEQLRFGASYLIAALEVALLVSGYCAIIFRRPLVALAEGAAMLVAYALIYFMLQLEDYALLAGTVALFVLLAVLMLFTGNLNKKKQLPSSAAEMELPKSE